MSLISLHSDFDIALYSLPRILFVLSSLSRISICLSNHVYYAAFARLLFRDNFPNLIFSLFLRLFHFPLVLLLFVFVDLLLNLLFSFLDYFGLPSFVNFFHLLFLLDLLFKLLFCPFLALIYYIRGIFFGVYS